jgi:transcriptional regulator with XRE-family HTH domain
MSLKGWEKRVLKAPGTAARVAEMEDELRLAAGLTALRERAGFSQRELARRMGVSQPRVAAIEQSRNVTLDVLGQYASAVGGQLEVTVAKGGSKIPLLVSPASGARRYAAKKKAATTGAGKRAPTGRRRPGS